MRKVELIEGVVFSVYTAAAVVVILVPPQTRLPNGLLGSHYSV